MSQENANQSQKHYENKEMSPIPKTQEEKDRSQEDMRERQMIRDKGATLGPDQRDPCHAELKEYQNCLSYQRKNAIVDCDDFLQAEANCRRFWSQVQNYRENVLKQSVLKWPVDKDIEKWRRKLPEFILTGQLVPPDDL